MRTVRPCRGVPRGRPLRLGRNTAGGGRQPPDTGGSSATSSPGPSVRSAAAGSPPTTAVPAAEIRPNSAPYRAVRSATTAATVDPSASTQDVPAISRSAGEETDLHDAETGDGAGRFAAHGSTRDGFCMRQGYPARRAARRQRFLLRPGLLLRSRLAVAMIAFLTDRRLADALPRSILGLDVKTEPIGKGAALHVRDLAPSAIILDAVPRPRARPRARGASIASSRAGAPLVIVVARADLDRFAWKRWPTR